MQNELYRVFVHTIQDIYNSETQITAALPKMISSAQDNDLKEALSNHLEETRVHVNRMGQVCQMLGIGTGQVTCQGTAGLIREAEEDIREFGPGPAGDAAIIANAQKVEHYEITNYGTVIEWAKQLNLDEPRNLLKQTIDEESKANEKLTKIAENQVNEVALKTARVESRGAALI